jgi:hypothetical protein
VQENAAAVVTFVLLGVYRWRPLMRATSATIRDPLQTEIGCENNAAFSDSLSLAAKSTRAVAPLFVSTWANDPRVRRSESDPIVKIFRERLGAVCRCTYGVSRAISSLIGSCHIEGWQRLLLALAVQAGDGIAMPMGSREHEHVSVSDGPEASEA